MKCKCGNEVGQPRVKPFPITIKTIENKTVDLLYMGGMSQFGECWFCTFPR